MVGPTKFHHFKTRNLLIQGGPYINLRLSKHINSGSVFSKTLHVVSNFSRLILHALFTAIPLTCVSPVFENCKIRMKFQEISESLKQQKISQKLQEIFLHR